MIIGTLLAVLLRTLLPVLIAGAVVAVAGIIVALIFASKLGKGSFQMTVSVSGVESTGLEIGVSSIVASSKPKKSANAKIKVNNDLAREIIDTLGAVIMECKLGYLELLDEEKKAEKENDEESAEKSEEKSDSEPEANELEKDDEKSES